MSNVEDPKLQGGRRGSLTLLLEGLEDSNKTVAKKSKPRRKTAPPIQINDNHGHRRGSLNELLQGLNENKETINSVISKLYRKANFESDKAQRAIIFLDGMDKIGQNVSVSELARKQVSSGFTITNQLTQFEIASYKYYIRIFIASKL